MSLYTKSTYSNHQDYDEKAIGFCIVLHELQEAFILQRLIDLGNKPPHYWSQSLAPYDLKAIGFHVFYFSLFRHPWTLGGQESNWLPHVAPLHFVLNWEISLVTIRISTFKLLLVTSLSIKLGGLLLVLPCKHWQSLSKW